VSRPRSLLSAYPLACAALAAALLATYANHFHSDFHFDDSHTIQNNLYIRDLRNIPQFFTSPQTFSSLPSNQSYRPLLTTTLAIDYRLGGGLNPLMFHVTSFTLFAIQCALMLVLFRRLMDHARPAAANRWLALLATAWYALHAGNAETVNYIIARGDILSTLGVVLAMVLFGGAGWPRRSGLYLVPAAAGMLGKEQAAVFAPLLFLYVAFFERELSLRDLLRPRTLAPVFRATWPAFALCGAMIVLWLRLLSTFNPGGTSRWEYLLTQPFVLVHYALTFILPVNLTADTDWKPIANPFDDRVIVGLAFIACALALAVACSRRRDTRPVSFGVLWFFIALLPTSSVMPLAEVTNDHRLYFPFVGASLAAWWAIGLVYARSAPMFAARPWLRSLAAVAAIFVLLAMAYGTRERNEVWRTEESLWLDVTRKSPENGRGLMTYGVIQMDKGNFAAAQQYFERALQYTPQYAYLHVNLGVLNGALGRAADAERYFLAAQQYGPQDPVSYYFYARWLESVGRTTEALEQVRHAIALSPAHLEAHELLTDLLAHQGEPAAPTAESWLALSLSQYQEHRFQECIESSEKALGLRPDYAEAFNNICAADNALGRYADAVAACRRALAIKPDFELARNNLAAAQSHVTNK
jgi:tetratricopeptide (TPR) repeat protein